MKRPTRLQGAIGAFSVAALLAAGTAIAGHGGTDTEGHTTLEQTICYPPSECGDPAKGFATLEQTEGEPRVVRNDLGANPRPQRDKRRVSLSYVAQITDFQLADEESPAREERFDSEPFQQASSSGHRPQEALVIDMVETSVRQINEFVTSPVPQGNGKRARLDNAVMTGDLADNMQSNETQWVRTLLEGGSLNPNSGTNDLAGTHCPPGTPMDDPENYTGVQDYDDYANDNPMFYDPEQPAGQYVTRGWPTYPNLLDRAQVEFTAEGLKVPSYVVFGNHDALYQGTVSAGPGLLTPGLTFEDTAVNCLKPVYPVANEQSLGPPPDPARLLQGLANGRVIQVPPDKNRHFVDKSQFKEIFFEGRQDDAHGFTHIDEEENRASTPRGQPVTPFSGQASYYSFSPKEGIRYIVLDTNSESGILISPGDGGSFSGGETGNIDHPQWLWLQDELQNAKDADELTIVFGHHNAKTMTNAREDEVSPCIGLQLGITQFGHDRFNPSCDRDPRFSTPLHHGDDLVNLFHQHPHVVAYVAGHTHENEITPFPKLGGGGFWEITSPAIADWPPQHRLIELMDNKDGTLSIFGTLLDHEGDIEAPASGTDADEAEFGVEELASIGRTLTYNDPQVGPSHGKVGSALDHNVELLVRDPRRRPRQ